MNNDSTEYLNYLRVFAAFAVVMLHIFSIPITPSYRECYSSMELFLCKGLKYLMFWSVPVFVMITGVLFLNPEKELSLAKLFKKYILRFVIVILSFGTLFCLLELMFKDHSLSFTKICQAILNSLMGKSWDHMWYIYMVIGLYMVIPLIKVFVNNVNDKLLFYALGILFCTTSLLPFVKNFLDIENHYSMFSIYIFYLLLGYVIHYKNFKLNNGLATAFLLLFALYIGIIQCGNFTHPRFGYESPIVVLAAFAFFSLGKNINRKRSKLIKFIGPLTFGVYIVHPVFINVCNKVWHLTSDKYSLMFSIMSMSLITIIGSIFLVFVLRLIPFVRERVL